MNLSKWAEAIGIMAVVLSLLFVGYEIRQNTSQLRTEGARALTEIVNDLNASAYSDSELTDLILRGKRDLDSLTPVERDRFDRYQFSRLNVAEYVLDLEQEGVSGLNFKYVDYVVWEYNNSPGLRAFIKANEENYVGSTILLERLLGR